MLNIGDVLYCKFGRNTRIDREEMFIIGKHYQISNIEICSFIKNFKTITFTKVYILGENGYEYYYVLEPSHNEYYQLYDYFADKKEERQIKLKNISKC